jgi:aspartate/tyrosine/aromatic aminotransferase
MCRDRKLKPIFDTAYHGLASGDLDKDAGAPR